MTTFKSFECYDLNRTLHSFLSSSGVLINEPMRNYNIEKLTKVASLCRLYVYQHFYHACIKSFETNFSRVLSWIEKQNPIKLAMMEVLKNNVYHNDYYKTKAIFVSIITKDGVDADKLRRIVTEDRFQHVFDTCKKMWEDNKHNFFRKRSLFKWSFSLFSDSVDMGLIESFNTEFNQTNVLKILANYKIFRINALIDQLAASDKQYYQYKLEYADTFDVEKLGVLKDNPVVVQELTKLEAIQLSPNYLKDFYLRDYILKLIPDANLRRIIKKNVVGLSDYFIYKGHIQNYRKFEDMEDMDMLSEPKSMSYDNRMINEQEMMNVSNTLNLNSPDIKTVFKQSVLYANEKLFCCMATFWSYINDAETKSPANYTFEYFEEFYNKFNFNDPKYNKYRAAVKSAMVNGSIYEMRYPLYILYRIKDFKFEKINVRYEEPKTLFEEVVNLVKYSFCFYTNNSIQKQISTYFRGYTENNLYKFDEYDENFFYHLNPTNTTNPMRVFRAGYDVNGKATKRWSSGFHTYKQGTDVFSVMIPEDDCMFLYFDIGACEIRMVAFASGDENLIRLFANKIDPYIYMAKEAFPGRDDSYYRGWRSAFKMVVLGLLYGRGANSVSRQIGLPVERCKEMIALFFRLFPRVREFIQSRREYCERTGLIDSYLGDVIAAEKARAYTVGINYFVQNSASVLLAEGFGNMILKSHEIGRPQSPKVVVHDSSTTGFYVRQFFEVVADIRQNFYDYIKTKYGVPFEYDIDLLPVNMRDKCPMKIEGNTLKISGNRLVLDEAHKKFSKHFDIQVVSEKSVSEDIGIVAHHFHNDSHPKINKFYVENGYVIPGKKKVEWSLCKKIALQS